MTWVDLYSLLLNLLVFVAANIPILLMITSILLFLVARRRRTCRRQLPAFLQSEHFRGFLELLDGAHVHLEDPRRASGCLL